MFDKSIKDLQSDLVVSLVEDIDQKLSLYALAVESDETSYVQTSWTVDEKTSGYIDRYGHLNFLFLLVDKDIWCRIDDQYSEYELFLYKRIKGED